MRNFDALALTVIVVVLLGFSGIHLTPQPVLEPDMSGQSMLGQNMLKQDLLSQAASIRSAVRSQRAFFREQVRAQIRSQIQVLKCQIR